MRTIEEISKRAALLNCKRQFGPFEECLLWSSFFGHADQMVGLCTGGQLGGRAGQRFVLCG